ncbi:MAG: ribonuclease P protein component [Candidatus Peribacteraceae bacterium]|nr:ribonuclease P protein component [Candidatus Peribacteraceae bacterium]MBP9850810.1 ribonuclease P protein component [Candidatus Peribacteraceae bacterium]
MQLYRLSGRKVCERVKQKGFLWRGKHFQARMLRGLSRGMPETAPAGLYIGVLTSTKLHKSAVKRNRMRRRCREAIRLSVLPKKELPAVQLLLMPRSSSLSAPFDELLADAEHLTASL